jgi:hypothetical protein
MGGGLVNFVESFVRAARRDAKGTGDAPRAAASEPRREPPARREPEPWRDPVPVVKDRDGHLHLLI